MRHISAFLLAFLFLLVTNRARADAVQELADQLRAIEGRVIPADSEQGKQLPGLLAQDARVRIRAANQRESAAYHALQSREDWERYREPRLQALRASLGQWSAPPKDLHVRVTRTLRGEGYVIDNLVFESRPGLLVTANLYKPAQPAGPMPGFVMTGRLESRAMLASLIGGGVV